MIEITDRREGRVLCQVSAGTLERAVLHATDLQEANLNGAGLEGTDLSAANLRDADLMGADLHNANLTEALLRGADLRNAVLVGASLRGADLTGARLEGTYVHGASYGPETRWPVNFDPVAHGAVWCPSAPEPAAESEEKLPLAYAGSETW